MVARLNQEETSQDEPLDPGEEKYRAPALEKGLDVLQLLSTERHPLTLSVICTRLDRSQGELFRIIQVLMTRGFIDRDAKSDGYYLTDMMFALAMKQPVTNSLVEIAIPAMRSLASEIGQSCHLALYSRGDIVVVARMESIEQIGFTVRVGYRRPLHLANSGSVLFAFQPEDVRARWLQQIEPAPSRKELEQFLAKMPGIKAAGYAKSGSSFVDGVIDVSAPIVRGDRAAAALTVPFIKTLHGNKSVANIVNPVKAAAAAITARLLEADSRA